MFANRFRSHMGLVMMAVVASAGAPPATLVAQQSAGASVVVAATATGSSLVRTPSSLVARSLSAVAPDAGALIESPAAAPVGGEVRAGPDVALMVVGGAGLVTGLIIGGDGGLVIATGGAVMGLIGLYRYLR